jgi:3-oxoacyl-[acyl-carrier protein] reductase
MTTLEGRVALITGAGGGLGGSHAELMSSRGADIIVHDVNRDAAEKTAEIVRANGQKALVIANDIRDTEALRTDIAAAEAEFGHIDILVNNAGVSGERLPMEDIDEDVFTRLFDIHVKGGFFAARAVVGGMKSRGYGRIVNTSSVFGMAGHTSASHYGGAKAALLGFTKSWAREFGPFNITVNAVAPGFVPTPMTTRPGQENILKERMKSIPLGRSGTPRDISFAVAWLASDEASYVTGQVISPNGGWTIVGI